MTPTRRFVALAGVLAVVSAGGVASAAPRPKAKPKLCNLVTDGAGDVKTGNESLDIVGADIATNAKTITAVIRVKKLTQEDLTSPTGRLYELSFAYEGRGQRLNAVVSAAGTTWSGGKGSGTLDTKKNEIRIHLPVDALIGRPSLKPGALLTNLMATSDLGNPLVAMPMTLLTAGDSAQGTKTYPIHAGSCVTPGV